MNSTHAQVIRGALASLTEGHPDDAKRLLESIARQSKNLPRETLLRIERANADVDIAQSLLVEAQKRRSDVVRGILEAHGPGPFIVRGVESTIVSRRYNGREEPVYFLRVVPHRAP